MSNRFEEKAKQRIRELIQLGDEVRASFRMHPNRVLRPDATLYHRWITSSLTFLAAALGEDSAHHSMFTRIHQTVAPRAGKTMELLGVLHAAREDIESGWVGRRDLLLTADAFDSLLEQADYLLEQGFKDPAAMLAGAVLESTLRKMCEVRDIPTDRQDKIGTLNDKLAKHHKPPAYGSMEHKLIIGRAELRNNADHGHFDEYKAEDVRDMIRWLREFAARHLA